MEAEAGGLGGGVAGLDELSERVLAFAVERGGGEEDIGIGAFLAALPEEGEGGAVEGVFAAGAFGVFTEPVEEAAGGVGIAGFDAADDFGGEVFRRFIDGDEAVFVAEFADEHVGGRIAGGVGRRHADAVAGGVIAIVGELGAGENEIGEYVEGEIGGGGAAAELLAAAAHGVGEGFFCVFGGVGAEVIGEEDEEVLDGGFGFTHHAGEEADGYVGGIGGGRDDLLEGTGAAEGVGEVEQLGADGAALRGGGDEIGGDGIVAALGDEAAGGVEGLGAFGIDGNGLGLAEGGRSAFDHGAGGDEEHAGFCGGLAGGGGVGKFLETAGVEEGEEEIFGDGEVALFLVDAFVGFDGFGEAILGGVAETVGIVFEGDGEIHVGGPAIGFEFDGFAEGGEGAGAVHAEGAEAPGEIVVADVAEDVPGVGGFGGDAGGFEGLGAGGFAEAGFEECAGGAGSGEGVFGVLGGEGAEFGEGAFDVAFAEEEFAGLIEVDESGFGLEEGQDGGAEGGAFGGGEQGGAGVEMESRGDGAIGIGGEAAGVGGGAEFLGGVLGEFAEAEAGGGRDAVAPFGGEGLVEFVGRGAGGGGRFGFGAEDFGEGVGDLHVANGGDGDGGIGDGAAGTGEFEAELEGGVEVGGRGEFVLIEFGVEVGFAGVVFEGFAEFLRVGGGVGFAEADGGVGAEGSGFDDAGFALGGEDDFAGFDGEIIGGEEGGSAEEGGGGGVGD